MEASEGVGNDEKSNSESIIRPSVGWEVISIITCCMEIIASQSGILQNFKERKVGRSNTTHYQFSGDHLSSSAALIMV